MATSGFELIGSAGTRHWHYNGIKLVSISWTTEHTGGLGKAVAVNLQLQGKTYPGTILGSPGCPTSFSFDMENDVYFAKGAVTLNIDPVGSDVWLDADFRYGELSAKFKDSLNAWQYRK
ncbi:hypothetical protein Cylst_2395 [Cylindrospermum stagnale PCC 7417]|uniref:Uncharacterized protein n=1 Tax=Cylindrospermum stagnale PCC 7417 TaxID=56107 RepID=K9WXS6_9NOST|nr:hypothetical protein [Cylindrospermum stagnale]AFZ24614.1 hypothetical protein Cylst_2395 [Cylindrospermum stagnale PCC 7417]